LYLSQFIEAHRQDYYDLLQGVRTDGDWIRWIRFFLLGVAETSRQAVRHAEHLHHMRREFRAKLPGRARPRELLDELFSNPYITVARAARQLKVTAPTAQKAIDRLRQAGILEEMTGRNWGRIYLARAILQALRTPPDADPPLANG
jgi:cell filamentation protein, protein adenylyltransferase